MALPLAERVADPRRGDACPDAADEPPTRQYDDKQVPDIVYAIARINAENRVVGLHVRARTTPRTVSNGVLYRPISGHAADPTRNSTTASADPSRRREHDNPRDERGHAGIQQDFIKYSSHCTLPHAACLTRRGFRACKHIGRRSVTN
jgi:hypothetical protein